MTLTYRHYGLLTLLTFLLALPGRMTLPPLDRDEPRYMEATRQMLTSGNFLDIRFQDQPRYLQPAGIYWLEAIAVSTTEHILGSNILRQTWPYRLPSLIAASLIIPLTAWIGTSLFSGTVGLLAAFFLMASTLFVAESHMATIDTVLLLDILATEALLLRCFLDRNAGQPTPRRIACLYWVAIGIGLMLKGPIILIPGLGTPLALSLVERSHSIWSHLHPRWGWLLSLALVLPWCLAIACVSHGDFFTRAVGHNLLGKVTHAQESHGFSPGYYLAIFLLSFWPGSFFAIKALPSIWAERHSFPVRFLLCWIIPHWLFFELLATKLPHYVLPTYPAIAILTAASLLFWPEKKLPRWGQGLINLYGLLWTGVGLAFCFAGSVFLVLYEHLISIREVLALLGSLPLIGTALFFLWHSKNHSATYCAIGAALLTQMGIFLAVIPHLGPIQLSSRIASAVEKVRPCPETVLISASYSEPSLIFLVGEKTRLLSPDLAAQFLHDHAHCDLALVSRKDQPLFQQTLQKLGMEIIEYDRIKGLNYSTGHKLDLGLFAAHNHHAQKTIQ